MTFDGPECIDFRPLINKKTELLEFEEKLNDSIYPFFNQMIKLKGDTNEYRMIYRNSNEEVMCMKGVLEKEFLHLGRDSDM